MSRMRAAAAALGMALVAATAANSPAALSQTAASERLVVANSASDTVSVIDASTNAVMATIPVGDRPTGAGAATFGSRVYVTNEMSGTVSIVDAAALAVVATVPVGIRPVGVAASPLGAEVWVANAGSHNVSVLSTATDAVVATVPVGVSPFGVAFSRDGGRAYVTSQDDRVWILDTATKAVITTVAVGHSPFGIAVLDELVFVTNQSSDTVSVIEGTIKVADVQAESDPTGIVAERNGGSVWVAKQAVSVVSVMWGYTEREFEWFPAHRPHSLAISMDDTRVYATGMSPVGGVVTVIGRSITIPVGDFPEGIALVSLSPPVISGQSWFSTGAKSRTGPAGSAVAVYAVGASAGVPYNLVLSSTSTCANPIAALNAVTVIPGPSGLIGTVRATIPPATPRGTYWLCFRHNAGATATGVVSFTVT